MRAGSWAWCFILLCVSYHPLVLAKLHQEHAHAPPVKAHHSQARATLAKVPQNHAHASTASHHRNDKHHKLQHRILGEENQNPNAQTQEPTGGLDEAQKATGDSGGDETPHQNEQTQELNGVLDETQKASGGSVGDETHHETQLQGVQEEPTTVTSDVIVDESHHEVQNEGELNGEIDSSGELDPKTAAGIAPPPKPEDDSKALPPVLKKVMNKLAQIVIGAFFGAAVGTMTGAGTMAGSGGDYGPVEAASHFWAGCIGGGYAGLLATGTNTDPKDRMKNAESKFAHAGVLGAILGSMAQAYSGSSDDDGPSASVSSSSSSSSNHNPATGAKTAGGKAILPSFENSGGTPILHSIISGGMGAWAVAYLEPELEYFVAPVSAILGGVHNRLQAQKDRAKQLATIGFAMMRTALIDSVKAKFMEQTMGDGDEE